MAKFLFIAFVSVAFVYVTTVYLLQVDREFTSQLSVEYESQEMRHVYTKFSLVNTTPEGETKYLLKSPNTVVLLSEEKTHLDFPNMLLYRDDKKPIAITADMGVVDHALNLTTLTHNVDVAIPTQDDHAVLETEKLLFNSITQVAYTDEYAKIVQGRNLMEGVGLEYRLDEEKIKFLNKVRGIYER
jgi:LPS export ABC transporter protein LptC